MRQFVLFVVTMLAAGQIVPAFAQTRVQAPVGRTADSWIDHYALGKEQETAALRAAGLGADWAVIHQLVARHLPRQTYLGESAAGRIALRAAHVRSTANFLVQSGYRARHLRHPAQARTVVRAGNMASWHDADALVLTAPIVFLADQVRIDRSPDNSADIVYRVREPIKSAPAKGTEFRYRLNGSFTVASAKPGSPPPPPPPPDPAAWELAGQKSVLFFMRAAGTGGSPFRMFSPMPVTGETVRPGYHSMTAETTLTAIRAAARAQLCSPGYVPIVAGANLPHKC